MRHFNSSLDVITTPASAVAAAVLTLLCGATATAQAQQMAPTGYTGAINTPTADVLPWGSATLSYTNSIPERASKFAGEPFGGLNAGFGVLPGLEIVGRLAFDGNLNCNLYEVTCKGRTRDLSVGAKYQLPLKLPLNTRVAIGFTDYGGAATNFRSAYGVGTTELGPVDVSLGYAKKASNTALLHGMFANAVLHVTEQLQVQAENDGQAKRLGVAFTQPINDQLALQLGLSRKLSGSAAQKTSQVTASVQYFFEKQAQRYRPGQRKPGSSVATGPTPERVKQNGQQTAAAQANALAAELKRNGYAQVAVRHARAKDGQPAAWHLMVEPLLKRHDQAAAIGQALAVWLDHMGSAPATLQLDLTYMGRSYQQVSTTRDCVAGFAAGQSQCTAGQSLTLGGSTPVAAVSEAAMDTLVNEDGALDYKPQFELGVDLVTSVGTDYGLVDHSLALDVGIQLQLAKGLFWQGNAQLPVSQSDDYRKNAPFRLLGHPKARVDQALVSYLMPVKLGAHTLNTQWSLGAVNAYSRGGQVDATWMDTSGLWRVGGTLGAYDRSNGVRKTTPALLSARRTVLPGEWMVEGTVGEFLGGDRGWMVKSQHWFGPVGLSFFVTSSDGKTAATPKRNFAGFEISVPFGGSWQKDYGWASVRGMDRFAWGQKTKVGDTDNVITGGYGEAPKPRHGVWTDFSDHDRAGATDAWAQRDRIRDAMAQEQ